MKKWINGLLLGMLFLIFLVGCSSKVSEDDLKENNWTIEPDEVDVICSPYTGH